MKFSEHFEIEVNDETEWFDPLLNLDTKLFVDPFLIYDQEFDEFVGSHDDIIALFQRQFENIAKTRGDKSHPLWSKTVRNLLFPEVEELCLGFTAFGTDGSGSGEDVAKSITSAIWNAIDSGVDSLDHFEEVQLFQKGIFRDRISDATAKMLFDRFARYTMRMCPDLPTKMSTFPRTRFDSGKNRWVAQSYRLPQNPYNNKSIILCPKIYLRPEPTINKDEFWSYMCHSEPSILRGEFGDDIVNNIDKDEIIRIARKYPEARERYVEQQENEGSRPYDYSRDPKGLFAWYVLTKSWIESSKPQLGFETPEAFQLFIESLVETFGNYVENQGGWKLLWNDNKIPKSEEAAQRLFQGIVMHACRANNIDLSAEANIGRGPVDYKVSQGSEFRALIELKLARNTRFWNGLEKQLPKYLAAEGVKRGFFVVIAFNEKDLDKTIGIEQRCRAINEATDYEISSIVIDASRDKISASKLI